jgi:L-lactate dehydrogenase (cytochrome)
MGIQNFVLWNAGFATLKPYMPKGLDMKQLGLFMNKTFSGRLNAEKLHQ